MESAKVVVTVKPLVEHHIRTLVCVVDALREFFKVAGYTIDRFILQSDSTEVKVVLHYLRSSTRHLESIDQAHESIVNAEGG